MRSLNRGETDVRIRTVRMIRWHINVEINRQCLDADSDVIAGRVLDNVDAGASLNALESHDVRDCLFEPAGACRRQANVLARDVVSRSDLNDELRRWHSI